MEGRKAQGMHLVPATAVKLQKSRVLSIPGVKTVSAIDQLLVTIINLMADKVFLFLRLRRYLHLQVMLGLDGGRKSTRKSIIAMSTACVPGLTFAPRNRCFPRLTLRSRVFLGYEVHQLPEDTALTRCTHPPPRRYPSRPLPQGLHPEGDHEVVGQRLTFPFPFVHQQPHDCGNKTINRWETSL